MNDKWSNQSKPDCSLSIATKPSDRRIDSVEMAHLTKMKESSYDYLGVIAASSALAIGVGLQRTELAVLGNMMVEAKWINSDNIGQLVGLN